MKRENIIIEGDLMREYHYTVFFEPLDDGGYNVVVPAIPEICTFGGTREQARAMVQDAIRCHLEGLRALGQELPEDVAIDREPLRERVPVTLVA